MKKQSENDKLAAKYGCCVRTIRNWKREGAPLQDKDLMAAWLANRKNVPVKLASDSFHEPEGAPDTMPQELGAGAALRRLERAEGAAYQRLQKALAGTDAMAVKASRETWLRIADQLRHFERAVSEHKRELGLLVNRPEIEEALKMFGAAIAQSWAQSMPQILHTVRHEPDVHRAREMLERLSYHHFAHSLAIGQAAKVPRWIIEAFGDSHQNGQWKPVFFSKVDRLAELISQWVELSAKAVIEHTPPTPANALKELPKI